MGTYFTMSMRCNKSTAQDFDLLPLGASTAINPADGSLWDRTSLFDFGWGPETGYYKVPMPDFSELLALVLQSTDPEDHDGAAAIILSAYPDALLRQCQAWMTDPAYLQSFQKLAVTFHLEDAQNRSPILQKCWHQIHTDAKQWQEVSDYANKINRKKSN